MPTKKPIGTLRRAAPRPAYEYHVETASPGDGALADLLGRLGADGWLLAAPPEAVEGGTRCIFYRGA